MEHAEIEKLIKVINGELHVDIPLFWNNPQGAIRFDFAQIGDAEARKVVQSVLLLLFENTPFWACAYGSDSGKEFFDNDLFLLQPEIVVIPYHSSVDKDWFEYEHDSIACVLTSLKLFSVNKYISYVFRLEFLSNTVFLIDSIRKVAVHVYDRRGMDIATYDAGIRKMLIEKFGFYLAEGKDY